MKRDRKRMQRNEKSVVKSVLNLIIWRITHVFVLFWFSAFLIGIGFAVGLVLLERIRTGGL